MNSPHLLVQIEKDFQDEIVLNNGQALYLDASYNTFENRVVEGKLVAVPPKFSDVFQEGDTVFFHHSLVVGKDNQRPVVDWKERIFRLDYTRDLTFNCLVYLIKRDGEYKSVNDFIFIKPTEVDKYEMIGSIYVPGSAEEEESNKGTIVYSNDFNYQEIGVKEGDEVYITAKGRYEMEIDGEVLWRMRSTRNILAVDVA